MTEPLLTDVSQRHVSLTSDRLRHTPEHPEMREHERKLGETLRDPDPVVRSRTDDPVCLFHRFYERLTIADKHLCVLVKQPTTTFRSHIVFHRPGKARGGPMGKVKVWYDSEADFLEVMFQEKESYLRETSSDQVMERVDMDGKVIGFSIPNIGALKGRTVDVELAGSSR